MLALGIAGMCNACVARRIMRPPQPMFPEKGQAEYRGVELALQSFSVTGQDSNDSVESIAELKKTFLSYVQSRSNFSRILDLTDGGQAPDSKEDKANPRIDAEVNIHVDHTTKRTWIMDFFTAYPWLGTWPITPVWGKATVRVSARIKDDNGSKLWTKTSNASTNYKMIMYSWYRTKPIEKAYRKSTEQAFLTIADDLAAKQKEIYAQLKFPSKALADKTKTPRAITAVFDVQDPSGTFDKKILSQLTDYLTIGLAEKGAYRVIPKQQLQQELLTRKKTSYGACFDEGCQIELGKAVAAEKLMAPKLLKFGNKCALSAAIFDLRSETTDRSASARTDCAIEALIDAADELIQKLSE